MLQLVAPKGSYTTVPYHMQVRSYGVNVGVAEYRSVHHQIPTSSES